MTTTKPPPQDFQNKNPAPRAAVATVAAHPPFEVRENKLCAELGISKDELRKRRQYFLTQGQHWDYVDKRVLLTSVGAEILRGTRQAVVPAEFAANAATADSETPRPLKGLLLEKNAPPVTFDGKLVAWAMPAHNKKLLVAYLPGTDPQNPLNLVSLFVRSNLHFLRGMAVPGPGRSVRQVSQSTFELLGEPPRYRGRW
jgi:hypothetical protein